MGIGDMVSITLGFFVGTHNENEATGIPYSAPP